MSVHFAVPHLFQFQVAPIPSESSATQAEPEAPQPEPNRAAYDEHAMHDGLDGDEHGEAEAIRVLYQFDVG